MTTLDTDGFFIYRAATTQALAAKTSAMLVPDEVPPPWPGETVSRAEEEISNFLGPFSLWLFL